MTQYQNIFKGVQKILLEKTIYLIPEFKGKILKSCVVDLVKYIRLERAKAKREMVERIEKELPLYCVKKDEKNLIDIEDIKFLLNQLQRETFLLNNESPQSKI